MLEKEFQTIIKSTNGNYSKREKFCVKIVNLNSQKKIFSNDLYVILYIIRSLYCYIKFRHRIYERLSYIIEF